MTATASHGSAAPATGSSQQQPHAAATAEAAWRKADAPMSCTVVEISGIVRMTAYINGTYYLQPSQNYADPPVYKCWVGLRERGLFLYYARDGRWHVGTHWEQRSSRPSWRLRSGPCEPGTLPGKVKLWEALTAAGWMPMFVRTIAAGRKQVEAAWKIADATTTAVQVEVSGVPRFPVPAPCQIGYFSDVNGTYDLQPLESVLSAPVFRRRRMGLLERELWLFHAEDGRWHVGITREKNERRPGRRFRSAQCLRLPTGESAAGPAGGATISLPGAMGSWQVARLSSWIAAPFDYLLSSCCGVCFWESPTFGWSQAQAKVTTLARAKMEDAWKPGDTAGLPHKVHIQASSNGCCGRLGPTLALGGVYELQAVPSNRDPPVFLRQTCCALGPNLWLYYARDGRWHVGRDHERNQQMPGWRLRSAECKAGTLPSAAGPWERLSCLGWLSSWSLARRSGWERFAYTGWTSSQVTVSPTCSQSSCWPSRKTKESGEPTEEAPGDSSERSSPKASETESHQARWRTWTTALAQGLSRSKQFCTGAGPCITRAQQICCQGDLCCGAVGCLAERSTSCLCAGIRAAYDISSGMCVAGCSGCDKPSCCAAPWCSRCDKPSCSPAECCSQFIMPSSRSSCCTPSSVARSLGACASSSADSCFVGLRALLQCLCPSLQQRADTDRISSDCGVRPAPEQETELSRQNSEPLTSKDDQQQLLQELYQRRQQALLEVAVLEAADAEEPEPEYFEVKGNIGYDGWRQEGPASWKRR
eukprot:TRINITY_DN110166_c0_g1_i1.p1 TRINITY_DN110166_c0_g1~~TRINITY_DN110166_c0_g1_i1.p1  ORF type:complete len:761 (-),score=107.72 TRINITY_DN110166_c0_g1_i1:214-2496(-)